MSWKGVSSDNWDNSDNDTLHLWDVGTGICKATFTAHGYHIDTAEISPDGSTLVIWSKTGAFELWDVETCLPKITFTGKVKNVKSVHLSPDSRTLISISNDTIHLWDAETGKCKVTLTEDGMGTGTSVHLSPDSRTLIGISNDKINRYSSNERGTIRLWDVETGKRKTIPTEEGKPMVKPILLSSDNRTLISVSEGETGKHSSRYGIIGLSDVGTGTLKATFTEISAVDVESVSLSSNNRMLASRDREGTIHVWDVETGTCKATFTKFTDVETDERDPIGNITYAALSPDGSIVASGNDVGTILLWEISK